MQSELDSITKEVPPSSLLQQATAQDKNLDELANTLQKFYDLNFEEQNKFKEGIAMEKINNTAVMKMMLATIITIIDEYKPRDNDKMNEANLLQTKKVLKDLTHGLFNTLQNFNYNDRNHKILLLGKMIQSLYGRY